jgi:hypothetical protein
MEMEGLIMKKNILLSIIIGVFITGILALTMTSCKRSNVQEPGMIPNAGFRISLSGTANPSTIWVPETGDAAPSVIRVRALHSDGSPAQFYDVIFQVGAVGFFSGFKISTVVRTDASGMAEVTFEIPAAANIKTELVTSVTATLVDNGRIDNTLAEVFDVIPIHIIPYLDQGVMIHGHVRTPAGNGVEGVQIVLDGEVGLADGVTVTRPSGSYEFFVKSGWYGTITPVSSGYTFIPVSYVFDISAPIQFDILDLDFVAIFAGGNALAVDVTQWDVPVAGGTQTIDVYNGTGDAAISYIVVPDSSWIHVSPNSGTTPGSFTITADENTSGGNRSGTVTVTSTGTEVSSVTISVNQLGNEVPSDARLAVDIQTLNSTTSDSISYILTTVPASDWITVSQTNGSTPDTFTITTAANSGPARTGQVILTPTTTGVSNTVTITVNQEAGPSIAINVASKNVAVGGEVFSVTVTNPSNSDACPFSVTKSAGTGWLVISPTTGLTPAGISITVNANGTGQMRTGTVTFTNTSAGSTQTVDLFVTQQGS